MKDNRKRNEAALQENGPKFTAFVNRQQTIGRDVSGPTFQLINSVEDTGINRDVVCGQDRIPNRNGAKRIAIMGTAIATLVTED